MRLISLTLLSQSMNPIEVEITPEMRSSAATKANRHGDIKNSLLKGKGNYAGYLGEEIALAYLTNVEEHNTYKHDMIVRNGDDVYTVEVKTKARTVEPQGFYSCHVAATSKHQTPDIYIFCSVIVKKSPQRGWVLGWLTRDEFYEKAKFVKAESEDGNTSFFQKTDAYVVDINQLNPMDEL